MPVEWFDTHAHLSDPKFEADRDSIVQSAFHDGIKGIIEIADGPAEWAKAQSLAEKNSGRMWWAAGLHPYYSDQASPENWSLLKKCSSHAQFVAIGEIGLDYAKCPIPKEIQISAFSDALDLAEKCNRPVIIHCRDAYDDLMPLLKDRFSSHRGLSPGVVHCFSGNAGQADALIQMGFYLGVDGPLTYPKSDELRAIFSTIPMEHIVLETDSPYLPPQPFRGQRNQPSYLVHVGNRLAELRSISIEILSQQLMKNSFNLFRLNPTEN